MEPIQPIEIEFLINNGQLKADAEKAKKDLMDIGYTAEEATEKVNKRINNLLQNKALSTLKVDAGQVKTQFNGISNSINQLTREIPAFTYSAQTGFLAISNNIPILADEITRLKQRNIELTASGEKAVPVWKQLVTGLFSWQTALSVGVSLLTIYGKDFVDFISGLFKTKDALDATKFAQESLNKAYESSSYKKAIQNVLELKSNIDLAKQGILDKQTVIDQYNKTLGDTAGKVNTLAEAEQFIVDKAPAYVEAMLYKAAATAASAEAADKIAENFKKQKELEDEITASQARQKELLEKGPSQAGQASGQFTNLGAASEAQAQKIRQQEINDLLAERNKIQNDGIDIIEKLNAKALEAAKKAGIDLFGGSGDGDSKTTVSSRKRLLEQIADLDREYARKQLDDNQAELDALREKFDKIRKLVTDFNKDPKNSKVKIDVEQLDPIQEKAEIDLLYRQDTTTLKKELEAQKKLFKEYEDYKNELGKTEADKRYADQLQGFETYASLLKQRIKENQEAFKAFDIGDANAAQEERVELLKKSLEEEQAAQDKHFAELLTKYRSFEQQRQILNEQYSQNYRRLVSEGRFDEAAELTRQLKQELEKIGQAELESTESYRRLVLGVENLSRDAALSVIDSAKQMVEAMLAAGKISQLQADEINKKITAAQKALDKQDNENSTSKQLLDRATDLDKLSAAFLNLGDALSYYDEGLGDTLTTIGELTGVMSDAVKAGASFASGDIIGGISGAISAVAGLFRIGARARESERQATQKLLELQYEREDGERRLNKLQRERNLEKAKEIELTLEGLRAQQAALELGKQQAAQDERALLRELQQLQYITGSRKEKYGGFLGIGRKTRVVNTYGDLLGKTFEEIESFYERGLLEGRAEKLFEQLRALKDEGQNIDELLRQIEADTRNVLTGTTENAISDSIINGLKQGYTSFEEFAGDIERLLQDAILNSIKYNVLEEPIKELYKEFAKYAESEGELTQAEAETIRQKYQQQVQAAIDQYNQLSEILDQDALAASEAQQGLKGDLRRELTEETASELVGLFRGYHDISRRMLEANIMHYEKEQQYMNNMLGLIAINTAIEVNTRNTVLALEKALLSLDNIDDNTEKIYLQDLG